MLNKAMHKIRRKSKRKEEEKRRSIHGDNTNVDGTSIVTVDGKMLLTNTIIKEEFLHPQKLGEIAIESDIFSLCSG